MDFDIAFGPNWKTNYIVETPDPSNDMVAYTNMMLHSMLAGAATFMVMAVIYMTTEDELRGKQHNRIRELEAKVEELESQVELLEQAHADEEERADKAEVAFAKALKENCRLQEEIEELHNEMDALVQRVSFKRKRLNPPGEDNTEAA